MFGRIFGRRNSSLNATLLASRRFLSSGDPEWKGPKGFKKMVHDPKILYASAIVISAGIAYFNRPEVAQAEAAAEGKKFKNRFYADSQIAHMKIFAGSGNHELGREIAAHLGTNLGRAKVGAFADGETSIKILDEVRGDDIFLIQSAPAPNTSPDSSIMEVMLMTSAIRRASAKRITVVLPYMSYSRQTATYDGNLPRPIAAADVCRMLETLGADNIVIVDAHNPRIEGFFNVPVVNIDPQSLAIHYVTNALEEPLDHNAVVIAADVHGAERAKFFWNRLKAAGVSNAEFATFAVSRKERPSRIADGESIPRPDVSIKDTEFFVGDVKDRDVIIVDDMIDSGSLCEKVSAIAKQHGAKRIFFYATHGLFSRGSLDKIDKSAVNECIVTNTVMMPLNAMSSKIQILSVGKVLAEAIKRIHEDQSTTGLADEQEGQNK